MSIQLKVSNSLKELSKALCADIKAGHLSVFQSNYIVTQTEGMNNWVKLQLAANLGIAANCRFLKPNDLILQIYYLLGGQYLHPLSSENQCWLLYKLLAEKDFTDRFGGVSQYYKLEGPDKDLKRMALAEKVADLFDQYQVYRPEMIREWNDGQLNDVQDEGWQKFLWIKAKHLSSERLPDKTFIGNFILEALKDPALQEKLRLNIPSVHVFGLSVITGFHMELFYKIGQYINLSFHILNPAPSVYWFEDKDEKQISILKKRGFFDSSETSTGNTLLTSWGKVIQNTFSLLFQYDDLINAYDEVSIEEPLEDTLLHKIQGDIFHNRSEEERRFLSEIDIKDGSIVINSCYTPAREVEVLYNYLVHLIDKREELLSPRDIVVMVSDIDAYAPYIKAIFNNAPYKFPFHIADESYLSEDSISGALQSVLAMSRQDFKAEEVLQLLDSSYIRKRFGLTDLSLIRKVVNRANIRFGMEGSIEDESIYVSWKYGLERIIYGICMSGEDEYETEGESLYPVDVVEGSDSLEVIRFCHFVQVLMDSINEREKARTLTEWVSYIDSVLHSLIVEPGENVDEEYGVLLKTLEKYHVLTGIVTEGVTYDVFSRHFTESIGDVRKSGSFAFGGITFCSLIPMRSIPFKVVGLLGLNFDKFPRKETQVSFNLMEKTKRRGDRNVKENDKHLFLETLLSAQQYLYISYIGQSVKDNTVVPPSAMVDELIDYIQTGLQGKKNANGVLVTKHALHNFSRKYKEEDLNFYNYLDDSKKGKEVICNSNADQSELDFKEINLEQLIKFLKHPVEGYYNNVLNIYYRDEEVLLNDTELFDLDHLQKWGLRQDLLFTKDDERDVLKNRLLKTGKLPLKNMADVVIEQVDQDVAPVRALFQNVIGKDERHIIQLDLNFEDIGTQLRGSINCYGNNIVIVSWSKSENKYLLEAYIKYLAVRASGQPCQLSFISTSKGKVYRGVPFEQAAAAAKLKGLIKLFKQGHDAILPFYADFPFDPKHIPGLTEEDFKRKVKEKLGHYMYPCTDAYVLKKYEQGYFNETIAFEQYVVSAGKLIEPLADLFPEYYS